MPIILFLLTVFSRLPFTSKYIYHLDSGHFILGMKHYDVMLHQPHPPGYFLYILLGRVCDIFLQDEHYSLILLSIIFSGLTVVTVYYLGREMFDKRTGIIAALLAVTSPNFWFHGEVALTYTSEAFFSALIGLLCWKVFQGKSKYLWISISFLALAVGFRQSSVLFLFPLWVLSVRKESLPRIFAGLALGGAVFLSWFIPMVIVAGGLESYYGAFEELWNFNTGHNSVFERGGPQFLFFLRILHTFIFFSLGAALPLLILSCYVLIRSSKYTLLITPITGFMTAWMIPSLLFYLLIFIHPANPGYTLVLLPPLMIVCSVALQYLENELFRLVRRNFNHAIVIIALFINTGIFLFYPLPVSRTEINDHDRDISAIIKGLNAFNPRTTVLFIGPYSFYSYRHLMLYLPQFSVYQVDVRFTSSGQKRNLFGGSNNISFTAENLSLPEGITTFAALTVENDKALPNVDSKLSIVRATNDFAIVSGPIKYLLLLYPQLKPYITSGGNQEEIAFENCSKQ